MAQNAVPGFSTITLSTLTSGLSEWHPYLLRSRRSTSRLGRRLAVTMINERDSQVLGRAALLGWVRSLVSAMPRILVGSVLASTAVRLLAGAVAWLNARVIGHPAWWAAPAIGATAAGLLLWRTRIGRLGGGTGTDVFILAQRGLGDRPHWRLGLTKLAATVLTVGSGGSGGLVGPAVLVGSGVTPLLGATVTAPARLDHESDRMVLAAGAAAAVAVLWGAPVAAALLPCEVIYRQRVAWRLVPPALVGGAVGRLVYRLGGGAGASPTPIPETWLVHILFAAIIGAVAALSGICLVTGLRAMERLWLLTGPMARRPGGRIPWRALVLLASGGAFAALAARAVGTGILGFTPLQTLISWTADAGQGWSDLGVAAGKTVATVATVGSGGSGGVVGPALHIGAALGRGAATLLDGCGVLLGAAGMAGCLAAVSNVPLAASLLIIETFGLATAPYALVASGVGFAVARRWVAYTALAADSGHDGHTRGQETGDVDDPG